MLERVLMLFSDTGGGVGIQLGGGGERSSSIFLRIQCPCPASVYLQRLSSTVEQEILGNSLPKSTIRSRNVSRDSIRTPATTRKNQATLGIPNGDLSEPIDTLDL